VVFILPCSVVVFLVKAKARCGKVTSVRASVISDQFQFVLTHLFRVLLDNVINFFLFFFAVKQDNGVSLVLFKTFSCVKKHSYNCVKLDVRKSPQNLKTFSVPTMDAIEKSTVIHHILLEDGKKVFVEVFNVTIDLRLDRRFVISDLSQTSVQAGLGTATDEREGFIRIFH